MTFTPTLLLRTSLLSTLLLSKSRGQKGLISSNWVPLQSPMPSLLWLSEVIPPRVSSNHESWYWKKTKGLSSLISLSILEDNFGSFLTEWMCKLCLQSKQSTKGPPFHQLSLSYLKELWSWDKVGKKGLDRMSRLMSYRITSLFNFRSSWHCDLKRDLL